jgi:hypothetical protein
MLILAVDFVDTNKHEWEVYDQFKVLEKAPIAGDG